MKKNHGGEVAAKHALARSPHWETTKKKYLEKNPFCVACGPTRSPKKSLQVHHQHPFHYCVLAGRPDLELDFRNLITLCEVEVGEGAENHHVLLGHLDEFHSYNPHVLEHSTGPYHGRSKAEIVADQQYQAALKNRPKKWPEMSEKEQQDFRAVLNAHLPPLKWEEMTREMQAACRADPKKWPFVRMP